MLADRLEEWAKAYIAEGYQEGIRKGFQSVLLKVLAKRFGAISAETIELISNASLADIEHWFDRAIDASSLTDVFVD